MYCNKRDSLDENETDYSEEAANDLEEDSEKRLPRSGRGSRGFNFGGARGGWRKINWGNLGGRNNGGILESWIDGCWTFAFLVVLPCGARAVCHACILLYLVVRLICDI